MYSWQRAKIIKTVQACYDIKSITVLPAKIFQYKAGQHCELCIPGTNIIRKYSIVSPIHTSGQLEFGVQLIENGALSPKLWELKEGDEIEIRGPIGEVFVWDSRHSGPLILIGAGSGITPLLSMYHSYRYLYREGIYVFIVSAKDESRIMHYDSLKEILIPRFTATDGRIDAQFLKDNIGMLVSNKNTRCYVCGPDNFIDDIVDLVLNLGIDEKNIKSDRFI